MINETASIQADLQFDNHIKDYATNMKTLNNNKLSLKTAAAEAPPISEAIDTATHPLANGTATKIMEVMEETPMQKFYKDKVIFLTGGTGFLGKVTIEKLLRATDVSQIFLLMRAKKGKDVQARLDDLFNEPIFGLLKKVNPDYREKITYIAGDVSLPYLGISPEDRELIREQVNIIIHGAATVKFDEKLKIAIPLNVGGTGEMLKLAREIVNLKAVVHISTAFANCVHSHIEEKIYSYELTGENACKLAECLDEQTLADITPILLKNFPNTYTFTKALAEDIICKEAGNLPVTIFRPSIVCPTYREPIIGWTDNMHGPSGIIVGVGSGVLRVFCAKMDNVAQLVPVDCCVNAMLSSAWDIARNTYDKPPVYHYVPDAESQVNWRYFMEHALSIGRRQPLSKSIWYPSITIARYRVTFLILAFFYHILPGLFMDMLILLIGKKPRMLKIYRKIHKFVDVIMFFAVNEIKFENGNMRALVDKLEGGDKQLFACDMRDVDWKRLLRHSTQGVRVFLVKDEMSTVAVALKRHKLLKVLHYVTLLVIYIMSYFILYQLFKFVFP